MDGIATILTSAGSVVTFLVSTAGDFLELITSNPALFIPFCIGVVAGIVGLVRKLKK